MANPNIPGVSESEQALLYAKLNEYNRGRASFKEAGVYLVVLPRPEKPHYSLWLYSPLPERQTILYIRDLTADVHTSLRMASSMLYYSRRCLILMEYNEKRMQSRGEDLIFFGKYRGHFLHEILEVDPNYLSWIAYKFVPQIPKQERFVKIARAYHSVHLDLMLRKTKEMRKSSCFLGEEGETVTNLRLKVMKVKLEDDPYKTRVIDGRPPEFYVTQRLTLHDASGNLVVLGIRSKHPSPASCTLPAMVHKYRPGEIIYVASARIARTFQHYGSKFTRLSHVKLINLNLSQSRQ